MAEHKHIVAFCWLMQGVGNVRRLRKGIRSIARVGRNNQRALRRIFFKHRPLTDSTRHPLSPAKHGYAQAPWPGLKENSYSSVPLDAAQDRLRPTALTYPAGSKEFSEDQLRAALDRVGLAPLSGRLDDVQHWALQLSPGEQQRIAFARALLQKPDWLFLDEATSALDERSEELLYKLLKEKLPNTTLVSIGHRPSLAGLHSRHLELKESAAGLRTLVPA
jgi:ABC-type oligopeptide transport system ATPase subunit